MDSLVLQQQQNLAKHVNHGRNKHHTNIGTQALRIIVQTQMIAAIDCGVTQRMRTHAGNTVTFLHAQKLLKMA